MRSGVLALFLLLTACVSARAQEIVYTNISGGHDQIFKMTSNGTGVTQLSTGTNNTGPVEWSWDGSKVIWATAGGVITIANADGSNQHTLSNETTGADLDPAFSPDGTKIVFTYVSNPNSTPPYTEIHEINVDGTDETLIIAPGSYLTDAAHFDPTGTYIVVESTYPHSAQSWPFSLFTCAVANCPSTWGAVSPLATTSPETQYADPKYSSDGTEIYMSYLNGTALNVAEIKPSGTGFTQLTSYTCSPLTGEAGDPGPGPNGTYVFEYDDGYQGSCTYQSNNSTPTYVYYDNSSSTVSTGQNCSNIGCSPRIMNGGLPVVVAGPPAANHCTVSGAVSEVSTEIAVPNDIVGVGGRHFFMVQNTGTTNPMNVAIGSGNVATSSDIYLAPGASWVMAAQGYALVPGGDIAVIAPDGNTSYSLCDW